MYYASTKSNVSVVSSYITVSASISATTTFTSITSLGNGAYNPSYVTSFLSCSRTTTVVGGYESTNASINNGIKDILVEISLLVKRELVFKLYGGGFREIDFCLTIPNNPYPSVYAYPLIDPPSGHSQPRDNTRGDSFTQWLVLYGACNQWHALPSFNICLRRSIFKYFITRKNVVYQLLRVFR